LSSEIEIYILTTFPNIRHVKGGKQEQMGTKKKGQEIYSKPKKHKATQATNTKSHSRQTQSRNNNTLTPTHTIYWTPFPFIKKTRTFSQSPNEPLPRD
jgi:hypothetical protein